MSTLITGFSWHAWRLLTFRPNFDGLPKTPAIVFALIGLSTPLVLAAQGPLIATANAALLAFLVIRFQAFQIVSALALISLTTNMIAIGLKYGLPDQPAIAESIRYYETVLWIFTGYRWLHPKPHA